MQRRQNGLTRTQHRIFTVLSDGLPHRKAELQACLNDDLGVGLPNQLSGLRKLLRKQDKDILCQYINRRLHYRIVQVLPSVAPPGN